MEFQMGARIWLAMALLASLIAAGTAAETKRPADAGDAVAGRELALAACTGCHIVSPDQPFAPVLKGPPDFRAIANGTDVTAASLRRRIAALPQVPPHGRMANPLLKEAEIANVAAYIMTLRKHGANQ